ncbi:hypothetical protein FR483_n126L [Paramecium bursaria Chlorella virus FR483]|uniref:Uncharacterized protein n126L n=1 Tax=Paramecium bursaria Chlorella virus FR483 TaxID=399781 RepID=A7J6I0_PBCVF|nr:hypothetical protein FR483_n126L [Paramecium bursaria Chlorella virus FR483]ABT15411.1 hypothetical protein FR483_n126L [Paramecium bursaria Chlorella virus FR483]
MPLKPCFQAEPRVYQISRHQLLDQRVCCTMYRITFVGESLQPTANGVYTIFLPRIKTSLVRRRSSPYVHLLPRKV